MGRAVALATRTSCFKIGKGDLAGAVREARDQGNAGPDARGTQQQWLRGPGAGAAAVVTTRVGAITLSILELMTRAGKR